MNTPSTQNIWRKSSPWASLKHAVDLSLSQLIQLAPVVLTSVAYRANQYSFAQPDNGFLEVAWAEPIPGATGYRLRLVVAESGDVVDRVFPVLMEPGTSTQGSLKLGSNTLPAGNYRIEIQTQGDRQKYVDSEWVRSQQIITQLAKPNVVEAHNISDPSDRDRSGARRWNGVEVAYYYNPDTRVFNRVNNIPVNIGLVYNRILFSHGADDQLIQEISLDSGFLSGKQRTFPIALFPPPDTWKISLLALGSSNRIIPAKEFELHGFNGSRKVADGYKYCTVSYSDQSSGTYSIRILFDQHLPRH
ncbi:hypothetical protein IQ254_24630 [Nodosilinea sp. LEGE 07088]|uniref:hypothetical protein n=1 Tax=Nodosilinea sp. LEGE 07088 TaxID=2777968 RepID=UPI0018808B94|nr:hypothetical protein [Nodosilinea sp. LEGE 07088]MBE9140346.1 hypothetical protein [Nodosilinea sp. LEGE 07088]